jgi:ABC-type sugar transport system ATPase subunit
MTAMPVPIRPPAYAFHDVVRRFRAKSVLTGINLTVKPGQFLAIIGKSTLLRLLAGLDQPGGGRIERASGPTATRVMFQEPRLLQWARVVDNVAVGLTGLADRVVVLAGKVALNIPRPRRHGTPQAAQYEQTVPPVGRRTQPLKGPAMPPDISWFRPTSGDTRYLGTSDFGRAPTNDYMRRIAVTSEALGYDSLLIPTGASCQDPWAPPPA